jgi:hypothetical protein
MSVKDHLAMRRSVEVVLSFNPVSIDFVECRSRRSLSGIAAMPVSGEGPSVSEARWRAALCPAGRKTVLIGNAG